MAEVYNSLRVDQIKTDEFVIQQTPVMLSIATTIVPQTHGDRDLLVLNNASSMTMTIDAPTRVGTVYRFMYGGSAASSATVLIDGNALMHGALQDVDTDGRHLGTRPDGVTHNTITIGASAAAYNITMVSDANDQWVVYGKVACPTNTTFTAV
jgi:hypothetical protein